MQLRIDISFKGDLKTAGIASIEANFADEYRADIPWTQYKHLRDTSNGLAYSNACRIAEKDWAIMNTADEVIISLDIDPAHYPVLGCSISADGEKLKAPIVFKQFRHSVPEVCVIGSLKPVPKPRFKLTA